MKELGVILITLGLLIGGSHHYKASDSYIRNRVVMIHSDESACSGIQIKSPHGKVYILTAAHCKSTLVNGKTKAQLEDGKEVEVEFVAEDPNADLMLLSAANSKYINVSKHLYPHEHVHTITHGHAYPSYRTDGEYVTEEMIDIPIFPISDEESEHECLMPKYRQVLHFDLFNPAVSIECDLHANETITTANVMPGSSGGPLLNDSGELIGIVCAMNPNGFNAFVTLSDIKEFLKDK